MKKEKEIVGIFGFGDKDSDYDDSILEMYGDNEELDEELKEISSKTEKVDSETEAMNKKLYAKLKKKK